MAHLRQNVNVIRGENRRVFISFTRKRAESDLIGNQLERILKRKTGYADKIKKRYKNMEKCSLQILS